MVFPGVTRSSKVRSSPHNNRADAHKGQELSIIKMHLQLTSAHLSKHHDEVVVVVLVNSGGRQLKLSGLHSSLTFPSCPILPYPALPCPSGPAWLAWIPPRTSSQLVSLPYPFVPSRPPSRQPRRRQLQTALDSHCRRLHRVCQLRNGQQWHALVPWQPIESSDGAHFWQDGHAWPATAAVPALPCPFLPFLPST